MSDLRKEPGLGAVGRPDESPGSLITPRGAKGDGVRRLTRFPLLIVGALALLVLGAISYTMMQRQHSQVAGGSRAPVEPPAISAPARSPVEPPAPSRVQPQVVSIPVPVDDRAVEEDPAPHDGSADLPSDQRAKAEPPPPGPSYDSRAWEERMALIRRIEQDRLAAAAQALQADAGVASFSQHAQRQVSNGPSSSGHPMSGGSAGMSTSQSAPDMGMFTGAPPWNDGGGFGGGANEVGSASSDRNQAFLRGRTDPDIYLPHTRMAPLSDKEIKAGTVIPGVMIGGINSGLPGQIIGQVRQNVYDSATGQHLLIPAGARLVGTYESNIARGQDRALVAWQRIIYPDGSSLSLDMMPGADVSGFSGFEDKVNNHYARTFVNAFMLSLFSSGIQLSQPQATGNQYDSQQVLAAEIGRQLGQVGMEMIRRDMDIQPTIEVRPGYRFNIMVTKDMILPTWDGHPLAPGHQR